ncbi:unnamed protein product [Linum tenue]|uniref:Uncharacterized protein n=1 Tax=Linum tenue TaxID=586396 RepID=A0AAV0H452_9ROSI|nr:unnamed protein product [Linum tenue]
MMKLAKLLHVKGFHITFVNNDYNHRRLLKSRGAASLDGLPDFHFRSIPDGLPMTDDDQSTPRHCPAPFRSLIVDELNKSATSPPVTCIVSDGIMSFTADVAEELGIPVVLFWTLSGCGFSAYAHYKDLMDRGITPLKGQCFPSRIEKPAVPSEKSSLAQF